jgi:hypothetical protein
MTKLTNQDVVAAIMRWPGLYEDEAGRRFKGMPVSQVPSQLIHCGWRNVSHLDESNLEAIGCIVVTARYIGGAHPKRFCRVVIAQ